jgi:valyl-tRNA synthetase
MEIPKQYTPLGTEDKWYKRWMDSGCFKSQPDNREPFTIVIPPPNVTGVLHMGHMLNNTIQDVLIRRARMQGKNACWVPGTDHASIATEAKVVSKLRSEGIEKSSLTREQFLDHAWQWKEKHGGIILDQLKKLGASCDWDRTKFTMDPDMSEAVIDVFIDLHKKGLVYRGVRMINWDPSAQTALSDEEVIFKETPSKLYYIKYFIEDSSESITIATTRPETILGDTAICVHPEDERYSHLVGKNVFVPLVNRAIPIIADEYVDREFGTGALKVTPAHDVNDYMLGIKFNLPVIDVIASNGTMSDAAQLYIGQDRFAVRKQIVKDLETSNNLVKSEDIINKVGHSERTDSVIEPRLSLQWFVKMGEMARPALDAVNNGSVKLHPAKFVNTYKHWMENVKDWCISRQLWWGQQIPAWYDSQGDFVVAKTEQEAIAAFNDKGKSFSIGQLKQDEDVLDTWFSSWLWPISVFDPEFVNKPKSEWNEDLRYYYPTHDLVTAPEILFFWVARMIMAGIEYTGEVPFSNVYLTGIVRDKLGRKMSKSLGNSPDPIDLIHKYGADGVRMGMLLTSPAGNDLPFDESLCEQGRNFNNKIWNAFRLLSGWEVADIEQPESSKQAIHWFGERLKEEVKNVEELFQKYRISEALMCLYKLTWDDFCAWYLEAIKPAYQQPIDRKTLNETKAYFEELLKLLHPFTPFITEEIWHFLSERAPGTFLMMDAQTKVSSFDSQVIQEFEQVRNVVAAVRNFRNEKGISPKETLDLSCGSRTQQNLLPFTAVLEKLGNLSSLNYVSEKPQGSFQLMVGNDEFFLPANESMDLEAEKEKLEKELIYTRGFLDSVLKKLQNERFMANAKKEVVDSEKQKEADAIQKIQALENQLLLLNEMN